MAARTVWSLLAKLRADALRSNPHLAQASPARREGVVFAHALRHLPIGLPPGASLAGEFGWEWCTPSELARWEADDAPAPTPAPPAAAPSPQQLMADRFHCFGSDGGGGHTTVDYERVVTEGLQRFLVQIDTEMAGAAQDKQEFLAGMRAALEGVIAWAERYAQLAETLAEAAEAAEGDPARARLRELAARCRRVPAAPAASFADALQSIWLVHLAVGLSEGTGSSLSLGRFDQYLLALFLRDQEQGIPLDVLETALAEFFRALNDFFGDAACALNLGGLDASGRCQLNPLSETIVRVARRLRLASPLLAARIHRSLDPRIHELYADPVLCAMGQPTFYGEEACLEALLRRGVPAEEAHGWAVNSCMGLMMPGQEWSNMWGTVLNLLLPLELALNHGRPFRHELPLNLATRPPDDYGDFDTLFATVCSYTTELIDLYLTQTEQATERRGQEHPNPFVSALLADCIRRGQDRLLGGCRYQTVIVEAFGLVNAADALVAISELAFARRRYPLAELVQAAQVDFAGHADILHAARHTPHYGNGDPRADAMVRRLSDHFAAAVTQHSRPGLWYLPSFHTLNAHVVAGAKTAASLDGRRAGEPLAKNIGTTPGRTTEGHTGLVRSAAAVDQQAFSGGQALDLRVDPALLDGPEPRGKLRALLRTYFDMGGLEVQVNALSPAVLRQAMADPEHHRDLLVRIAGYSAHYVTLPEAVQREMIVRFEAGM